jgi:hypothetical protein
MIKSVLILLIIFQLPILSCLQPASKQDDFWNLAVGKKQKLRLSTYVTAQTVKQMFAEESGRREVLSLLHCYGITKVYLEVYRGGLVISPELINESVRFLKENGFEVTGGIATVPGEGFGVAQEGPLEWFNWQNTRTQDDLRKVIGASAPFFGSFIVDDFLCTSDTSLESKLARGGRSWSEYRRTLLTDLSQSVIINPAKKKNPAIKVIIKYPQWYDRFHLFGYDVEKESKLFDEIWVGTESRGQYTQRFGYVQPYEGFINYRWLSTVAGEKTGGAWFDHEDCTDQDFLDQAYQSVLAGAKELIIFSFDSFITGHPGHHLLLRDFENLCNLAEAVATHPVSGPVGYKPPNSDAGGDLYLLDYIGMLGVSIIPESLYPENARVILLPTQAAADTAIFPKIIKSLSNGAKIIMTSGFVANAKEGEKLAKLAQIKWPLQGLHCEAESIVSEEKIYNLKMPLISDYQIISDSAKILLRTSSKAGFSFLVQNQKGNVLILNSHTFSQQDFDAAGEHLLCPRQIGLLELPESWVNKIRISFYAEGDPVIDAPSRVSFQQLSKKSFLIHNYNGENISLHIMLPEADDYKDALSGKNISSARNNIELEMQPRSRIWFVNIKQ